MDIKYFNVATLIATGFFVVMLAFTRRSHEEWLVVYIVSLVVIWGSYFILRKK
tara:strand:+ start:28 stop:186 length:159 start_codon:yes stop_codon:yes gene_type:complete